MSYLIPKDELTLTDIRNFRSSAVEKGIARALELKIAPDRLQLSVRPFFCLLDAQAATEQWNTAPLAVINTPYSVFQATAQPVLLANKLAVFFKVGVETAPLPVAQLIFRSGGAAGNILAQFDLEQLVNALETEGYFTEVVVIDPGRMFAIQVTARIATTVFARVQLGGLVIEPAGQLLA